MIRVIRAALAAALSASPALVFADAPKGWFLSGTSAKSYATGLAEGSAAKGRKAAFLRSQGPVGKGGFGTVMQSIDAGRYAGKRVRFSAAVRADGVAGWAGLWLRVDGPYGKVLAFDNMDKRPIKGTSGWTRHAVVLEIARDAQELAYGLLLSGEGSVLLDEVRLEPVGPEVPTTAPPLARSSLPEPANLDFEE